MTQVIFLYFLYFVLRLQQQCSTPAYWYLKPPCSDCIACHEVSFTIIHDSRSARKEELSEGNVRAYSQQG